MFSSEFKSTWSTPLVLSGLIAGVGLVGLVVDNTTMRVITSALIAVVFVSGLSIFSGNSGIMSFGHVAFMAIGAYATAFLTIPSALKSTMFSAMPEPLGFLVSAQAPYGLALVVSGLAAAILAAVTAPAMVRLGGLQSGIATLALLLIVFTVLNNWTAVTRGSSSMIGILPNANVWWAGGTAVIAIGIAWLYRVSRSGLQLRATREDAGAAAAAGVDVGRHRGIAWLLSAFLCGLAGSLYASFLTTFTVSSFFISAMFGFVVMIVVGGYLSLSGAVIGALVISVVQEILRRFQDGQFTGGAAMPAGIADLVLGVIMLAVLIWRPLGIMGDRELSFGALWGRLRPRVGQKSVPDS